MSKEITTLMRLLNNSKGSKEALEKHISGNAALRTSGHPLPADKGESPKLLSRKELKKLRQKTKKALEKQENEISDNHEGDSNLNESVEALIDPSSIDPNDNDVRDSASNNNMEPLDNLLEATTNMFPEVNGNEVFANIKEIQTTIPVPPDPLLPDDVVNQAVVTSNDSTAVRAEDSSVKQTTLPSGVVSMAPVPKDLGPANTEERKAFIKHLVFMVEEATKCNLWRILTEPCSKDKQAEYTEIQRAELKECLQEWRDKVKKCERSYDEFYRSCHPCSSHHSYGQPCISFTGAREFFKQLKDEQIESICENFKLVFSKSVGMSTGPSYKGLLVLTPPWGLLGLGYSLRDYSFTFDHLNSNNYALGTLAERLVEKGMLAAAGEDDHRSDGEAGQQPHPVDAGSV